MGASAGPDIVDTGLVLALDAADRNSYPGSGTAWVDLKLDAGAGPPIVVEYLVVAGGGGGSSGAGGGGGAGGLLTGSISLTSNSYSIVVGSGGTGAGSYPAGNYSPATSGGNSSFSNVIAIGGGRGGGQNDVANSGGSGGGGGGGTNAPSQQVAGIGTAGQGNSGASGVQNSRGGGGGGSGSAGSVVTGGSSTNISISGTSTAYAGGGGAGTYSLTAGNGGGGGAGNGTQGISVRGGDALANTGSGGGGGGGEGASLFRTAGGGNGGSGIVIVRYPGSQRATGGTVTSVAGYTIHTFTTSGTFITNMGNNGTLVNGVGYNSGNGGSLVFDGVDDYVTAPLSSQFEFGTGEFAVEAWVNLTSTTTINSRILGIGDGANGSPAVYSGWGLLVRNISGTIYLTFQRYDGTSIIYEAVIPSFSTNQWFHFVATRNASNTLTLYSNGVAISTTASVTQSYNSVNSQPLYSGIYYDGNIPAGYKYANFRISNARIYKGKGLTASEISQNYNALRSRFIITSSPLDGSAADRAAPSASHLVSLGITTNGFYYIDLPTLGPTQIYCILDPAVDGGGWMVLWGAASGSTNYTYSFSASRDDISNSPINGFYSLSYAKRSAINALCTQNKTLVYAGSNSNWLRFDGYIWNSNSHTSGNFRFEFNSSLVTSNGTVDSSVEVGLTNFGVGGGGDFGIAINTDGLDHHNTGSYYNLNSGCANMYLYQYAAGYKVNTGLSGWYNATAGCTTDNENDLPLLVAMK